MARRFQIELSKISKRDFDAIRAFDQRRISAAVDSKLCVDPDVETRDKKCLGSEPANFSYTPPLWELRVDAFRIFYEVDRDGEVVYVHAIRQKPASKTTAEVLNEADGN
jgi:mRNA-degrading endonuclease RelE of RelBE toxin-antitoxin system